MRLTLRYFAAIREAIGRDGETCDIPSVTTVNEALPHLTARINGLDAALAAAPRRRYAVNRRFATGKSPLGDGDELAIFPPVTGG